MQADSPGEGQSELPPEDALPVPEQPSASPTTEPPSQSPAQSPTRSPTLYSPPTVIPYPNQPCTVDAARRCISSPNFPSGYRDDEVCRFNVSKRALVSVDFFNTEEDYDMFFVDDVGYSGGRGSSPDGAVVRNTLKWESDFTETSDGWSMCLKDALPEGSPTGTPTAYPTAYPTAGPSAAPWPAGCTREVAVDAEFSTPQPYLTPRDDKWCYASLCIDGDKIGHERDGCRGMCAAAIGGGGWLRIELANARTVCNVVLYAQHDIAYIGYLEIWAGDNSTAAVATGNKRCASTVSREPIDLGLMLQTVHAGCAGKHIFVHFAGTGSRHLHLLEVEVHTAMPGFPCSCETAGPTANPTAEPCYRGPLPGTEHPHADFGVCTQRGNGELCTPDFNCPPGYAVPVQSSFVIACNENFQYDASAIGNCTPRRCTRALRELPGANYSACAAMQSGQQCTPTCAPGYSPSGVITLACFDAHLGGRDEFVFDAGGIGCVPNNCSAGPNPGSLHPSANIEQLSQCKNLSTGQICSPADCAEHLVLSASSFEILCKADGTFNASALRCEVNTHPSCSGGPLPGTAGEHGSFAACNDLRTGDTCGVPFRCTTGYDVPAGRLQMDCDAKTQMYNASAAGQCTPKVCHTPLNVAPLASYDVCVGKFTGDVCQPRCPAGFSANATVHLTCSDLQLGGRTQYVYDAGSVACIPNSCRAADTSSLPSAGLAAIGPGCDLLSTGQSCTYVCADGYIAVHSTSSFELVCAANGTFAVPVDLCVAVDVGTAPIPCSNGPIPGTASTDAVFTKCNSRASGQRCVPEYNCSIGYAAPQVDFILNCDSNRQSYNASAAMPCVAKSCTAALGQPDAIADYSACYRNHTGDQCTPACSDGYSPTGSFNLVCSDVFLGSKVEFVFDVAGVGCVPNKCAAGPAAGSLTGYLSDADFTACLSNHTGQACLPSCPVGFTLSPGELPLICSISGTFDASRWTCEPPPPPPPPPGVCISGACVHGHVQPDCSCRCSTHWDGPLCSECPQPYRMHLDCSLPAVPSLSVDIGAAPLAQFDLPGFLSSVSQRLPPDAGSPQVAFVCALSAGQNEITEAHRRGDSCCRQQSPKLLCIPAAMNGRSRQAKVAAPLALVLDLELAGATAQNDSIVAYVASAAASVGIDASVRAPSVCMGQQKCSGSCVDPRRYCSYRGIVEEGADGDCKCVCEEHFAGDRCGRCARPGTTLCSISSGALSTAEGARHTVDVATAWTPPAECACPSPQTTCESLRCVTRPAQGADSGGDFRFPACAVGNSTVRCAIDSEGLRPARTLLYIDSPSAPEPYDAQGALPLVFVGNTTALTIRATQLGTSNESLCGRAHELSLLDIPTDWTGAIAAVDAQGTTVGAFFETTRCVQFDTFFDVHGVAAHTPHDTPDAVLNPQCSGTVSPCPIGAVCAGVLGANGVITVRGLVRAVSYTMRVVMHPFPGSPYFSSPLPCEFILRVLPGRAAQLAVDSSAGRWAWPVLQDKLFPPLIIRVMDVHGNTYAGDAGAGTQPITAVRVSVWLTDADNDNSFTPNVATSESPLPALPDVTEHLTDRAVDSLGMAAFDLQLTHTAYGRSYALHFALQRSEEDSERSRPPLRVELPLPQCPDERRMAVYGRDMCITCPTGLECNGGHRTKLLPGFWRAVPWDYHPIRCPHPRNCVGDANDTANDSNAVGFPPRNDTLCKEGAGGAACALCDPGWRLAADAQGNTQCDQCGDSAQPILAAIQLLLIFVAMVIIIWGKLPTTLQRAGRTGQMLKVFIETIQIASILAQVPVVMRAMVGVSQLTPFVNLNQNLALLCTLPSVSYRSSLAFHGLLPFIMTPIVIMAQLIVKLIRHCKEGREPGQDGSPLGDEAALELDQQVLLACSACTAWDCLRCETCRHTRCQRCLRNCISKQHAIVPVPMIGEGCRLRLPVRYEIILGVMVGSFLVLPTMMTKFTERWQCVTLKLAEDGGNCSALFPERCSTVSRLRADVTIPCSDPATAALSVSCIIGWGVLTAVLLCVALSCAAARQAKDVDQQEGEAGQDVAGKEHGKLKRLPGAGLHSALAIAAWGNTYYAYRKPCWWWEGYIIVWKTSLFLCFALRLDRAFLFATLLCFLGVVLHLAVRPYHDKYTSYFALVGHGLLTSAMLTALLVTRAGLHEPADSFEDLDTFSQVALVVVGACAVGFLLGVAFLFLRVLSRALPLAYQMHTSGEILDADIAEPEAVHLAEMIARFIGAPPQRLTHSALEDWRARYVADIPPLVCEADLEQLSTLYTSLLDLAAAGPFGELIRELTSGLTPGATEIELARRGHDLLRKHGDEMPGFGAIELLVLELYTMEGPDVDGTVGFDAPRWREFEELPYSAQAVEIALEQYKAEAGGSGGSKDYSPSLPDGSDAALKAEVSALLEQLRDGLYDEVMAAQAAYKKYKKDVGDTRNQSLYRPVCAALRFVQAAAADSAGGEALMKALDQVVKQGFLNVIMVLMYAARPVPELLGGEATLWRGLADLPAAVHRWHRLLKPGSFVGWAPPTSTSFDKDAAFSFATGGRSVIFCMRGVLEGVPLWCLSRYPQERELLLPPFTRWKVEEVLQGPPLQITLRYLGSYRGKVSAIAARRVAADESKMMGMAPACQDDATAVDTVT
eukprot:TRINITY_DN593_c0_g2_i1.p1 TRINITY_DN593_c0_g2~~TRINITY_DN593_c0_g2_i1.p1  ORF type:complete len:2827 (+),score=273.18 TRINITY_DN593_c0_g2_i1:576-8483(+)